MIKPEEDRQAEYDRAIKHLQNSIEQKSMKSTNIN